ncbi:MAG: Hpt domain-containing protein [Candidatus Aureabacteria bacterium]|nr:Hpt domain-containing protein [Candidatus Auribacterota bacterium]
MKTDEEQSLDDKTVSRLCKIGGGKLLKEMIALFLDHAPKKLSVISEGAATSDWKMVEKGAHSLKSSAANLGAMKMHRISESLEQLSTEGKTDSLRPLIQELESEFIHVRERLLVISKEVSE